jgi:2-dehydro-3-deoxyphosphooctonate aldolase (KDO 8-P synthase)
VSRQSHRGPDLDESLRILVRVKQVTGLPIMTDVYESWQAKVVGEVADCLQIPALLSHQTDLIAACAATGRAINVKKAPVDSPQDVGDAVEKCRSFGCEDVMLTERGTSFGLGDQVVDFRGFAPMRCFAPLGFDATDAVSSADLGIRAALDEVAPLARAAVATGLDALCVEVDTGSERAPRHARQGLRPEDLDRLLGEIAAIGEAVSP